MLKLTKAKVRPLIPSVITAEMFVKGDISGEGAIEIAGKVDGDIRCVSVLVKEGGVINGDVTAEKVEMQGRVNGNLIGRNISCGATAKVYGNITHQSLHIEEGAFVEGICHKHAKDSDKALSEEYAEELASKNTVVFKGKKKK